MPDQTTRKVISEILAGNNLEETNVEEILHKAKTAQAVISFSYSILKALSGNFGSYFLTFTSLKDKFLADPLGRDSNN